MDIIQQDPAKVIGGKKNRFDHIGTTAVTAIINGGMEGLGNEDVEEGIEDGSVGLLEDGVVKDGLVKSVGASHCIVELNGMT